MEKLLRNLRRAGWRVAIHEDFLLGGVELTSWLFIRDSGVYIKGEGKTDIDALRLVETQARTVGPLATMSERFWMRNEGK